VFFRRAPFDPLFTNINYRRRRTLSCEPRVLHREMPPRHRRQHATHSTYIPRGVARSRRRAIYSYILPPRIYCDNTGGIHTRFLTTRIFADCARYLYIIFNTLEICHAAKSRTLPGWRKRNTAGRARRAIRRYPAVAIRSAPRVYWCTCPPTIPSCLC